MDGYSTGEVVWLLSLGRQEAICDDASPRSGLASERTGVSSEGPPLPVSVRRWDVRRARNRVVASKRDRQMLELRGAGFTETEVAAETGVSQATVNRRVRASVREIVDELGGEHDQPAEAQSRTSMCMVCAVRPRARHEAVRRRVRGGWKTLVPERQGSLCEQCLDESREQARE